MIRCQSCQQPYPETGTPYQCPHCGGIYDDSRLPPYHPDHYEPALPGIWPYRHAFGLAEDSPVISLGEGNTPLVWSEFLGRDVALKLETQNPTASFKDRGTTLLTSFLMGRGVEAAVEDSSGNAGASFAAYAARSGMVARIYVPAYASGPKRVQMSRYGAKVVPVDGPRSHATRAALEDVAGGAVYASHSYLPHGIAGFATIAYELARDMDPPPRTLVMPVGHGSLLLGVARGFKALRGAGVVSDLPALIGVQAQACAPLAKAMAAGEDEPVQVREGETAAEGVRIREPYRGARVLEAVRETGGDILSVPEEEIIQGRKELAGRGFDVEMTSALVWDGLRRVIDHVADPVVLILTGHGLKES